MNPPVPPPPLSLFIFYHVAAIYSTDPESAMAFLGKERKETRNFLFFPFLLVFCF